MMRLDVAVLGAENVRIVLGTREPRIHQRHCAAHQSPFTQHRNETKLQSQTLCLEAVISI